MLLHPKNEEIGKVKRTTEKPPRAEALWFLYDTFHQFSVKIGIGVQAKEVTGGAPTGALALYGAISGSARLGVPD